MLNKLYLFFRFSLQWYCFIESSAGFGLCILWIYCKDKQVQYEKAIKSALTKHYRYSNASWDDAASCKHVTMCFVEFTAPDHIHLWYIQLHNHVITFKEGSSVGLKWHQPHTTTVYSAQERGCRNLARSLELYSH